MVNGSLTDGARLATLFQLRSASPRPIRLRPLQILQRRWASMRPGSRCSFSIRIRKCRIRSYLAQKPEILRYILQRSSSSARLNVFTGPGRDQTPRYAAVLFRNHPSDLLWTQLSASSADAKPLTCCSWPHCHKTRTYHAGATLMLISLRNVPRSIGLVSGDVR